MGKMEKRLNPMSKYTNQQKIADLQRILIWIKLQIPISIEKIYNNPSEQEFFEIQERLKEIEIDLNYGKLRYWKEK